MYILIYNNLIYQIMWHLFYIMYGDININSHFKSDKDSE